MGAPAHQALTAVLLASALAATSAHGALDVEVIRSTGGLPPHVVGRFEEPIGFQQTPGGPYYVFDRRGHTVYSVDSDRKSAVKLIEIGQELGRIIQPRGFNTSAAGSFVVADSPREVDRVQIFNAGGVRTGGFTLPSRQTSAELTLESVIINGVAS